MPNTTLMLNVTRDDISSEKMLRQAYRHLYMLQPLLDHGKDDLAKVNEAIKIIHNCLDDMYDNIELLTNYRDNTLSKVNVIDPVDPVA